LPDASEDPSQAGGVIVDEEQHGRVERLEFYRTLSPLAEPYWTALGTVRELESVLCVVCIDGRWGVGEACATPGYSDETSDEVWSLVTAVRMDPGSPASILKDTIAAWPPFARSAVATAIEQVSWSDESIPVGSGIALVATVNKRDAGALADEASAYLAAGHSTLKLKVGLDVAKDLERVEAVCERMRVDDGLRLDANQQYAFADAERLVKSVDPDKVVLLEQPFSTSAWDTAARLASLSSIPIMLDESIKRPDDIGRARDAGAGLVKLKLMKSGSCQSLAAHIALARDAGLGVVVGNGVASDVGCFPEVVTCVRSGVDVAIESNGFRKTLLFGREPALDVENGQVRLCASRLDVDQMVITNRATERFVAA
jgi:L-alanine-DL-glutamate epimerase-like enolase superfamily enzyme